MATTYPGTIDSFTNPSGTSTLDDPDHAGQHSDANDAIEAIEAVIGTTAGTSVLMDFSAGEFAVRQNSGGTISGTITANLASPTTTGTDSGTATLTNKTLTSPVINGTPVLDSTSAIPFYNDSLHRQAIINGNFDVWQRGTSVAGGTGGTTTVYTADRWLSYNGSGATTYSQQDGTGVTGSRYSLRSQRNSGQTATTTQYLVNALITDDSIKFRGQKLTLSFWAKCGANFSATSSILTAKFVTGKGTNENALSGFTSGIDFVSENKTLTTSWQKFTVTTTSVIASDITQIAIFFTYDPTGTAGANDWFEVTQVQLCAGQVALPFMPKSYGQELLDCQRYYETSAIHMVQQNCDTLRIVTLPMFFRVTKRTTPTMGNTNSGQTNVDVATVTALNEDLFDLNWRSTSTTDFQNTWTWTASAEL